MSTYHVHSWPAIFGGSLAALGSCALLVADVGSLSALTVDKALMPVLVGLTVLTGHLAWQAWHELRVFSALGMLIVSCVGIGLTVTDAMGRRAELRDTGVRLADDAETRRAALTRKMSEAVEILETHRTARDRECATGKGKLCDGKAYTVSTWEAAVAGYEAQIGRLPKPQAVDAKGARVAAVAGLMGYSGETARRGFALVEPFMLPALLELASIVLFGFGVGHARVAPVAPVSRHSDVSVQRPVVDKAENTPKVVRPPVAVMSDEDTIVVGLRRVGGVARSQRDLARAIGISDSELSKRLGNCRKVERVREDNRVVVRLKAIA